MWLIVCRCNFFSDSSSFPTALICFVFLMSHCIWSHNVSILDDRTALKCDQMQICDFFVCCVCEKSIFLLSKRNKYFFFFFFALSHFCLSNNKTIILCHHLTRREPTETPKGSKNIQLLLFLTSIVWTGMNEAFGGDYFSCGFCVSAVLVVVLEYLWDVLKTVTVWNILIELLGLKREGFCIFSVHGGGGWDEGCSVGCSVKPHCLMPLNPTYWTFNSRVEGGLIYVAAVHVYQSGCLRNSLVVWTVSQKLDKWLIVLHKHWRPSSSQRAKQILELGP